MASFLGRLGRSNTGPSQQQQQQQQINTAVPLGGGVRRKSPTTPTSQSIPYGGYEAQSGQQQPQDGTTGSYSQASTRPLYLCQPFVKAALVKGSFKTIVALPKDVDMNEWVAVNIVDFFHNLNHFLGIISEHCTRDSCPTMSAGPGMDYTWTSGPTKKQVKVPATEYTDYVLTWAEKTMGDESLFPTKAGREFSEMFPLTARHLYTQFLRIFAHLYHAHFSQIVHLSLEGHLNSLFAHFLVFGKTYNLLDPKECRAPKENWGFVIGDLMDSWRAMQILEF